MALRNIRILGDEILKKQAKEVTEMTPKIEELIDDMFETMYDANCALLFGFGFYDAFPVDVWMKRVMEYYPDGLPKCFDGIGGIAQQYLFHWARNNL